MNIKSTSALILTAIMGLSSFAFAHEKIEEKSIVGELEMIQVKELGMSFMSRIDTGANMSSINAKNIKVVGEKTKEDLRHHKGDKITFTIENEHGQEIDVLWLRLKVF